MTDAYPNKIAELMSEHIDTAMAHYTRWGQAPFRQYAPLLTALGCCTEVATFGKSSPMEAEQPDDCFELLTSDTLVDIFHTVETLSWQAFDKYALLDGLCRNDRWRRCITTPENALLFAATVMCFVVSASDPAFCSALKPFTPRIYKMLTDWCGIDSAEPIPLSAECVTRAMFGDAWWSVVVEPQDMITGLYSSFVLTSAPEFLPGLIARENGTPNIALPDLGWSLGPAA
jgi:hypothetical protein